MILVTAKFNVFAANRMVKKLRKFLKIKSRCSFIIMIRDILSLKPLLILLIIMSCMIVFEAFQQHYYITHFNLSEGSISLSKLIFLHFRRWLVWLVFTVPLVFLVYRGKAKHQTLTSGFLITYAIGVVVCLLASILSIAVLEAWLNGHLLDPKSLAENLRFYFFQKGPIYLVGNVGVVVLVNYYMSNQAHQFTIDKLSTLQDAHVKLSDEFNNKSYDDNSRFIQIKIGSQSKVVPIQSIQWIEAEDYCVRLHTRENGSYVLRGSMKMMEKVLPDSTFIRIHRKFIVNLEDVDRFFFSPQPAVRLTDETELAVAQSRVSNIKRQLSIKD